jgi:hypothetical protein
MNQVFLLSPARCDGKRAQVLLNPAATFALAEQIRCGDGAPLGDVFSFLSGLYFRGKLAYARQFGRSPGAGPPALVITTDRGLVAPDTKVTCEDLLAFSRVNIGDGDERYQMPLRRDVESLAERVGMRTRIVLLGSIATGKYVDILAQTFGPNLVFPSDFVGRGDMSRGGLLLRCVRDSRELAYQPVIGAVRHGKRPPRLERGH